jgi:HD domain
MPEVAGVRDRRAFLIFVGMQVAAWSVPASAMPIHSANAGEPRLFVTPMERDMSGSERSDFNDALAVGRALDLTLPDSHAVRDAYAQAEAESPPWLFNHVVRSWLYGAKLTQHRALFPDAELLAVAVLLHDLGLARGGAPDRRFEVLGADAGRAFALSHDMGERRAETIWDSIALHTTASIAQHKGLDVACCHHGIACDYGGVGYQELSDDNKKAILSAYPRLDMKNQLTTCLCGIAKNHPNTTRDNFIADFGIKYIPGYTRVSSVDFLHQAPFAE